MTVFYDGDTAPPRPRGNQDVGQGATSLRWHPSGQLRAAPVDLMRSQRAGLRRLACTDCGVSQGARMTRHAAGCTTPGTWVRQRADLPSSFKGLPEWSDV